MVVGPAKRQLLPPASGNGEHLPSITDVQMLTTRGSKATDGAKNRSCLVSTLENSDNFNNLRQIFLDKSQIHS